MQITFSTQIQKYDAKPLELKIEPEKLQPKVKDVSFEAKVEAKPDETEKIQDLQKSLAEHDINLRFRHDEDTKQLVVEMVDSKTGDAIRQMPSEVSLKLSAAFAKLQGQIVDKHI